MSRRRKSRRRPLLRRAVRVGAVLLGVAVLVGGNWWLVRRQFPSDARVANAAFDEALMAFVKERDYERAAEGFATAHGAQPTRTHALVMRSLSLAQLGRSTDARAVLDAALEFDVTYDPARVVLASIAADEQDYAAALSELRIAMESEPTPPIVHRMFAEVSLRAGDLPAAEQALQAATSDRSDDVDAWLDLGDVRLLRADRGGSSTSRKAAAEAYGEAEALVLRAESNDLPSRLRLARAIAGLARSSSGREFAEARAKLREVVDANPGNAKARTELARFLAATGESVAAETELNAMLGVTPTSDGFLLLRRVLKDGGRGDQSVAALRRGLGILSTDVPLAVALVSELIERGLLDQAEQELDAAVARCHDDVAFLETRGDLERARGRVSEARGDLKAATLHRRAARNAYGEAVKRSPRAMPLRKKLTGEVLEASVSGAAADVSENELSTARTYLEDLLAVYPTDADAAAWLGRLLLVEGRHKEARSVVAAFDVDGDPPLPVLRVIGLAEERSGRPAQAASAFVRLIDRVTSRDDPVRRNDRAATPSDWSAAVRSLLRVDETEHAVTLANAARAAHPSVHALAVLAARAHVAADRAEEALTILQAVPAGDPAAESARLVEAAILESLGRGDAGLALLSAADTARSPRLVIARAALLGRQGSVATAREQLAELADDDHRVERLVAEAALYLHVAPPDVDSALARLKQAATHATAPRAVNAVHADLLVAAASADAKRMPAAEHAVKAFSDSHPDSQEADYLRGRLALAQGRFEDARTELEKWYVRRDPSIAGWLSLAAARMQTGDLEGARALLDRAGNASPSDVRVRAAVVRARFDEGLAEVGRGNAAAAELALEGVHGDGGLDTALLVQSAARTALGNLADAEKVARRYAAARPTDTDARLVVAAIQLARGGEERVADAVAALRPIVQARPDDVAPRLALGLALVAGGRALDAEQVLRPAVRRDARIAAAHALALLRCDRSRDAAAAALEGSERFKTDPHLPLIAGDAALASRQISVAVAAYRRAAEREPASSAAVLGAAVAMASGGDMKSAKDWLASRVDDLRRPELGHAALADLAWRSGDLSTATVQAKRALELDRDLSPALIVSARIALSDGDTETALRQFTSALENAPSNVEALVGRARLLVAPEDRRARAALFDRALAVRPGDPGLLNARALTLVADDLRLDRALVDARAAHAAMPESAAISDTLGWVLVRTGDPRSALEFLDRAATELTEDAVVQYHAGVAAARSGHDERARAYLRRAAQT